MRHEVAEGPRPPAAAVHVHRVRPVAGEAPRHVLERLVTQLLELGGELVVAGVERVGQLGDRSVHVVHAVVRLHHGVAILVKLLLSAIPQERLVGRDHADAPRLYERLHGGQVHGRFFHPRFLVLRTFGVRGGAFHWYPLLVLDHVVVVILVRLHHHRRGGQGKKGAGEAVTHDESTWRSSELAKHID